MEVIFNDKTYDVDSEWYDADSANGIEQDRKTELICMAIDNHLPLTPNVPVSKDIVGKIFAAEHRGKAENFISEFQIRGSLKKVSMEYSEELKAELELAFHESNRFRGRVPRILDSIARVYTFLTKNNIEITAEDFVNRFNVNIVRDLIGSGIPQMEAVLLYMRYDASQCSNFIGKLDAAENVTSLITKAYIEDNPALFAAADWITEHTSTDSNTLKKVKKNADRITIDKNTTVEAVNTKLSNLNAETEIKKIERVYKKTGFKFKKCKCNLKGVGKISTEGDYNAYIMHGTDERQVRLGYDSFCCQKVEDVGESAMMHGLLNPKAGFWIVEDKKTGQIKAQAEVWEKDDDTLIFDNIEFANDADITLYKNIINKWLEDTEYKNCKMGTGYNMLGRSSDFRAGGPEMPSVTPYECYVISHEQEGEGIILDSEKQAAELLQKGIENHIPPYTFGDKERGITYYDYVYCDSERSTYWMKDNGVIEPYFSGRVNNNTLVQQIFDFAKNNADSGYAAMVAGFCINQLGLNDNLSEITHHQYEDSREVFADIYDNHAYMSCISNAYRSGISDDEIETDEELSEEEDEYDIF